MYKAVDIVIIPPKQVLELCYELNASFEDRRIDLNPINALPHLTLNMGVINSQDEQVLVQAVDELATKYRDIELTVDHIFDAGLKTDSACGLGITKSSELLSLHNDSVELLQPYLQDYYQEDIFADYEKGLGDSCMGWVKRFQSECIHENFDPHITLGFGRLPEIEEFSFQLGEIALYQLGDYCTCNRVIT